ncbi:MAG: ATP-binding protein [Burkholderiales bacterium]
MRRETWGDPDTGQHSWFDPTLLEGAEGKPPEDEAFVRLWRGFMTGRVMMALAVGLLQLFAYGLGQQLHPVVPPLCAAYLAATVAFRLIGRPKAPGQPFGRQWPLTVGVDLTVYSLLQLLQPGALNYSPLFALPLLLVSVLGSMRLALGTAAGITLLLLSSVWWASITTTGESGPRMLEAALIGSGYFLVALLVNQMASRLAREQSRSRRSQVAAHLQTQVNELVIETLSDGVAVVDRDGVVRAANPAARHLLGGAEGATNVPFGLATEASWWPLLDLVHSAFDGDTAGDTDVLLHHAGQGQRRLRVRTRLTSNSSPAAESLCVLFLHDLREMEARLRTEKLAAMGRMSTAVAHEIRNPLAAIVQANALLDEELTDPAHKRLAAMVRQNAHRLAKITEEVLDISRVQQQLDAPAAAAIDLDAAVGLGCAEWNTHQEAGHALTIKLAAPEVAVEFDPEHLRRILVNLLDNARRYAGRHPDSIQVTTRLSDAGAALLSVWSDGQPMEPAVEKHLFEPFFSSESRSTGLGLYICRELCARHSARIGYLRESRATARGSVGGNAFIVAFRAPVQDSELSEDDLASSPADSST